MFTQEERSEVRMVLYDELVKIHECMLKAGSYHYLCLVDGKPIYSHNPIGKVIWHTPWM